MAKKRLTKVPRKVADRLPSVITVPAVSMPGLHNHVHPGFISHRRRNIWRMYADLYPVDWVELPLEFRQLDDAHAVPFDTVVNINRYPTHFALSLRLGRHESLLRKPIPDLKIRSGRGQHHPAGPFNLDPSDPLVGDFLRVASTHGSAPDISRTLAAYSALRRF